MNNSICFISHPYHRGGVTQWMAHAFNYWDRSIGQVYFLSINPREDFISGGNRPLILELLDDQYKDNIFSVPVSTSFELGATEYKASIYKKLIERHIPKGAVLIPSDDEACWRAAASVASSYKMIGILHADDSAYYQLAKKYRTHVRAFVSVSNRIHQTLLSSIQFNVSHCEVIPCGIPTSSFTSSEPKKDQIAWVGRLSRYQKRAQDIPAVWNAVNDESKNVTLKIAGHGDFSIQLEQYIKTQNQPDRIVASGWISPHEVRQLLAESKVFLQTSDFEGMSVALMEALASGCTVVTTRVSGAEDFEKMARAKEVVFLYEAGDCQSAAVLIVKAIESFSEESRNRAAQLAIDLFDISNTNARLVTFLNKLSPVSNDNYTLSRIQILFSPVLAYLRWLKWKLVS
ncbi:MAG: glycosyltransferase [Cyclobacteriaceae bacterium]|nr:glycosyltransferase [Cyclobacteriaceae bacterium]